MIIYGLTCNLQRQIRTGNYYACVTRDASQVEKMSAAVKESVCETGRPRSTKLFGSRYTDVITTSYAEDFAKKRLSTALAKPQNNKNALVMQPVDWEWPRLMSAYKRSVDVLNRFYSRSTYQESYNTKEGDRRKLVHLKVPGVSDPSIPQYSLNSTMRSSYLVPTSNEVLNIDLMRYGCYRDRRVPARGIVPNLKFADSVVTALTGNGCHGQNQQVFRLPTITNKALTVK